MTENDFIMDRAVEDTLTYAADDCATLCQVAERLRKLADHYDAMSVRGWELSTPVHAGRMFYAQKGV